MTAPPEAKMVPREPTGEMMRAGYKVLHGTGHRERTHIDAWRAMWDVAAPAQPVEGERATLIELAEWYERQEKNDMERSARHAAEKPPNREWEQKAAERAQTMDRYARALRSAISPPAADSRDAARYRFLQKYPLSDAARLVVHAISSNQLDAAIDAAIVQKPDAACRATGASQ